jgi:hypothetical protein
MPKDTKFKPGQSGNPQTMFKPGNRYRWKTGQSGNPAGRASNRPVLPPVVRASSIDEGATSESGSPILEGARNRELWAIKPLLQHLPLTPDMTATSTNNEPTTGPAPLRDTAVDPKLSSTAGTATTLQSNSQVLKHTKTALDAAPPGPSVRASDGSPIPEWREYKVPRSSVDPRELATTVKAEPAFSPPRPVRAVAPTSPTAPTPTLDPRLDPNERSKGSAIYRLNNPPDRPTNTKEIGRYIVVENDKRINLADWGNNRVRRK